MADDEKFLVVPLGKKSKAITQTVSNDTAMQIMELLADGPMATSKVAEKLGIPLTTAQYNIEKLMEAGLVKIAKTKYSEKGREVKLYEAMNRAIIILPGKSATGAVMEALQRYIILLPVAAVCALAVEYLVPLAPSWGTAPSAVLTSSEKAVGAGQGITGSVADNFYYTASATPLPVPTTMPASLANAMPTLQATPLPPPMPSAAPLPLAAPAEATRSVADQVGQAVVPYFHHAGLLFFAGCLLVLLLLVALEYARYARTPRIKK